MVIRIYVRFSTRQLCKYWSNLGKFQTFVLNFVTLFRQHQFNQFCIRKSKLSVSWKKFVIKFKWSTLSSQFNTKMTFCGIHEHFSPNVLFICLYFFFTSKYFNLQQNIFRKKKKLSVSTMVWTRDENQNVNKNASGFSHTLLCIYIHI